MLCLVKGLSILSVDASNNRKYDRLLPVLIGSGSASVTSSASYMWKLASVFLLQRLLQEGSRQLAGLQQPENDLHGHQRYPHGTSKPRKFALSRWGSQGTGLESVGNVAHAV